MTLVDLRSQTLFNNASEKDLHLQEGKNVEFSVNASDHCTFRLETESSFEENSFKVPIVDEHDDWISNYFKDEPDAESCTAHTC